MTLKRANYHDKTVPTFKHDCDHCLFLGTVRTKEQSYGGVYDLYWCPDREHPNLSSVIARHGNEGSEYGSMHPPEAFSGPEEVIATWKKHERPYVFAMARAVKAGIYNGEFKDHFKDAG